MSKYVLVETIVQFKHQYIIELNDDDPKHLATDYWIKNSGNTDFVEYSQKFLGEFDITTREVTVDELNQIALDYAEDKEYTTPLEKAINKRKV
jgi:hypothetical protein